MKYPKFIKENDTIGIIAPSAGAYDIKKKNKFIKISQFSPLNPLPTSLLIVAISCFRF